MKLWQKISCIAIAVLLLIVGTCAVTLLIYAKNTIIQLSVAQGADKHDNLVRAFSNMTSYYSVEEMGSVTGESARKYCFQRFADETSVLKANGQTLYTQLSIDPSGYIAPPDAQTEDWSNYVIVNVDGHDLLMLCSRVESRQGSCVVYTVQDISGVYTSISRMGWIFAAISLVCVGIGVMLITLLVRSGMRPLVMLGASARRIAGGEYAWRAKATSNDEVGALAEDFNLMADAVQARIAQLTQTAERQRMFIAGLTHEFKTPMTSVLIHSDTLLNANMSADERDRSLFHIHEQIRWLERLTQKLNRLANLNEGIETEPVSASALLEDVRESVDDALARRETALMIESDDAVLHIDRDLMRSAIVNLVDNASKASQPGSPVILQAKNGVITVRDHGCGIPKTELAHICEPFYMVDRSRSKKQGGSGLGLALAAKIVEAHGARLSFESEEGAGVLATITFC